jgi:hypothetical protein
LLKSPTGRAKVNRAGVTTKVSAALSTLWLAAVKGSATMKEAEPTTVNAKPTGRATIKSRNATPKSELAARLALRPHRLNKQTHKTVNKLFFIEVPSRARLHMGWI